MDYTVLVSRRLSHLILTDLLSMEISAKACGGDHTGWWGGGGGGEGEEGWAPCSLLLVFLFTTRQIGLVQIEF